MRSVCFCLLLLLPACLAVNAGGADRIAHSRKLVTFHDDTTHAPVWVDGEKCYPWANCNYNVDIKGTDIAHYSRSTDTQCAQHCCENAACEVWVVDKGSGCYLKKNAVKEANGMWGHPAANVFKSCMKQPGDAGTGDVIIPTDDGTPVPDDTDTNTNTGNGYDEQCHILAYQYYPNDADDVYKRCVACKRAAPSKSGSCEQCLIVSKGFVYYVEGVATCLTGVGNLGASTQISGGSIEQCYLLAYQSFGKYGADIGLQCTQCIQRNYRNAGKCEQCVVTSSTQTDASTCLSYA